MNLTVQNKFYLNISERRKIKVNDEKEEEIFIKCTLVKKRKRKEKSQLPADNNTLIQQAYTQPWQTEDLITVNSNSNKTKHMIYEAKERAVEFNF